MNSSALIHAWEGALVTIVYAGGPFIVVALAVGLFMSVLQAATQLQENVLSFAPKVLAMLAVLAVGGSWILNQLVGFMVEASHTIERIGMVAGQ
jgi:flagellar biosynthetic protein FliQ